LADVIDRRRLLLAMQVWMCLAAGGLGLLTLTGAVTPGLVLAFRFALGVGAALNAPAWQAVIPEVVPREQLFAAVALDSAGFNVARATVPALGGLVVAAFGAGTGFLLNAASFLGVMLVVFRRRPESAGQIARA
jgi:MFS family permease